MNTAILFKSYVLKECFLHKEKFPTLLDVAKQFDDTKFIGYFNSDLMNALSEFNKHLVPYGSFPRVYYDYEGNDELWCLEFIPGTYVFNLLLYNFGFLLPAGDETGYNSERNRIIATLPERPGWKQMRLQ